jgi:putative sporulation protein YtxC
LIAISFENKLDGIFLYEKLTDLIGTESVNSMKGVNIRYSLEKGMTIYLDINHLYYEVIKPSILNILTEYIIESNEEKWILEQIQKAFYYHETDEQEQILAISQSIMEGEKMDVPKIENWQPREKLISNALSNLLVPNNSFTYESFLKFRLKVYREQLNKYVEIAIDEYKLEQEYQEIIDQLRKKINGRVSLFEKVHLVDDGSLHLYNEHFYKLSHEEIMNLLEKLKFVKQDVPLDSLIIRALISFAPKEIIIYSNMPDWGELHTIQNVFQERIKLMKLRDFKVIQRNNEKA